MKKMTNFLLLFIFVLISGCADTKIVTRTVPIEPTVIHPAPPNQLVLREVVWRVFNKERLLQFLEENEGQEVVLIAVSPEDYEDLSLNMQEIERYIREQKQIIIFYREAFPKKDASKDSQQNEEK